MILMTPSEMSGAGTASENVARGALGPPLGRLPLGLERGPSHGRAAGAPSSLFLRQLDWFLCAR